MLRHCACVCGRDGRGGCEEGMRGGGGAGQRDMVRDGRGWRYSSETTVEVSTALSMSK